MKTVAELNEIQAQWMAVDSNGPKAEVDRVCYAQTISKALEQSIYLTNQ